jgi:hypothetical protein
MSASPPIASELRHRRGSTRGAISGREQLQQGSPHSITSSARASSVGGYSDAEQLRSLD